MNQFYAVWLTVSGAVTLLLVGLGWRRRAAPGAMAFLVLTLALTVWSLAYAGYWLSLAFGARVFWMNVMYIGAATAPVAFFVLVQYFIGREGWLTWRAYFFLLLIPALTLLLAWTDPLHGLFFGMGRPVDAGRLLRGGPWFYIQLIYSYGLLAVNVALLFRAYTRTTSFYKRQARVVLGGALFPFGALILTLLGWHPSGLDLTPLAFTCTSLFLAYAFFGYRMMDLVPFGRDALIENMDDAIVVVDTQNRIVDINPKAMEYADPGLELPFGKQMKDAFSRWADVIPTYESFEGRVELKLAHAPFLWIELRVIPLKDRQGLLVGKLATWRDISARMQAEEKSRIFFRAVEQNPVAIVITDPEGRIEYINPRFTQLTGYTLDEVRGKNPRVLKSGETPEDTYEILWQIIKSGEVWEGEILNRKKNGELYWVYELIAPVLDEDGTATRFIAMQQDITATKHTETELRVVNTRLQMQLAEIESLHDQLREEAIRDGLTRLFNRRYMEETLEREMSRVERDPQPISVVMMDVDLFKSINDTYGHQAGDAVLQTLGTMLLENTRISDIACRFGGDEMLVVMPGATTDVAIARAEEWRTVFSQMTFAFGKDKISTTLSLGVASFPDHAHSTNELLNASDKALYWAKVERNHVVCYDPALMAGHSKRSDDIR